MAKTDYSQFHELAEQFSGDMPLRQICEQEDVSYRSYIAWRSREDLAPRRKKNRPEGMVEMGADMMPTADAGPSPKTTAVHIEFENGLRFDRAEMKVDSLIEFLTRIMGALCFEQTLNVSRSLERLLSTPRLRILYGFMMW